ncbi:RICIN domain-containing protein [Hymenobacter algoricola]|uniref:PA14 domain-containing protein n=1 Tax=Hymenobacter algoricola TaxID=486267 RepID=A0ABP7MCS8_9BACT
MLAGSASLAASGPASTSAAVAAAPVASAGTGLTAIYFANGSLAGAPVLKRLDSTVDFQWGLGSPAPGLPVDNFSVRWEGLISAPATGRYSFSILSNDGLRLWVNGKKVIDTWDGNGGGNNVGGSVSMAAGEKTTIKLEYYDEDGDARVELQWIPPGQAPQIIPSEHLYPVGSPLTPDPIVTSTPTAAKVAPAPRAAAAPAAPVAAKPKAAPAPAPVVAAAPAKVKRTKPVPEPKPEPAPKPAPVGPVVITPGVYTLSVRSSGKTLEITDETRTGRIPGQQSGPKVAAQWRVENAGSGFYRLMVPGGNKVLEVLGSSTSNGAEMELWPYYSGNNQMWQIEDTGEGFVKVIARHSRKSLTYKDSTDGGLQQWRYSGKDNQQWKLTPVVETAPPLLANMSNVLAVGANKMSVYPNPSNGVLQMAYQLNQDMPLGWVLYDQRGIAVKVSDYRRQASGQHHQTLDFSSLPAGDYNLNLTVGATTTKQQLLIRRPSAVAPAVQEEAK